jgi:hypothetical protein
MTDLTLELGAEGYPRPMAEEIDLRAALNAVSDVIQNRPRPLRDFDQIYMKAGDMVMQSEFIARWADGNAWRSSAMAMRSACASSICRHAASSRCVGHGPRSRPGGVRTRSPRHAQAPSRCLGGGFCAADELLARTEIRAAARGVRDAYFEVAARFARLSTALLIGMVAALADPRAGWIHRGGASIVNRRIVAWALACGGVAAVVPATVALSVDGPEQPTLGPQLPAAVPSLTQSARVAAAKVMLRDSSLARVLHAANDPAVATQQVSSPAVARTVQARGVRGMVLRDIGVWSDPAARAWGVELTVGLRAPVVITADWPTLAEPGSGWTAPRAHYTARNVTALTIDVDLRRRKVVDVEPDPNAQVDAPPGTGVAPPPEDAGA